MVTAKTFRCPVLRLRALGTLYLWLPRWQPLHRKAHGTGLISLSLSRGELDCGTRPGGENASSSEAGVERQNACYPYFSDDEGEAGRGSDSF